jgi:hypothetical protein
VAGPSLSAVEIAALAAHGDDLMGVHDVVSAQLFYQRAAKAGDRRAALRIGATFDPAFLDRANIRGVPSNSRRPFPGTGARVTSATPKPRAY